jgi:hypothetical protein
MLPTVVDESAFTDVVQRMRLYFAGTRAGSPNFLALSDYIDYSDLPENSDTRVMLDQWDRVQEQIDEHMQVLGYQDCRGYIYTLVDQMRIALGQQDKNFPISMRPASKAIIIFKNQSGLRILNVLQGIRDEILATETVGTSSLT